MTWFGWVLILWYVSAIIAAIAEVGKPRKPTTPASAAVLTFLGLLIIAGILFIGTGVR
jgi:hypothetical protein